LATALAVLRDPAVASGIGQFGAVQAVAPSLGVELSPVDVRDVREIERAVTALARGLNGGLIVTGSALAQRLHLPRCSVGHTPGRRTSRQVSGTPKNGR
jgi:hypothetical protein